MRGVCFVLRLDVDQKHFYQDRLGIDQALALLWHQNKINLDVLFI